MDTVQSLKEKIHIVDGTSIKRMILYFCGTEMEDEFRSVTEYGIEERSEVIVFLKSSTREMVNNNRPPGKFINVVVETSSSLLNSAKIPIEILDSSRVDEMGKLLLERKILPVDEYIFIHKQRVMNDGCSLRWHGVENGDYIYVFKGTVGGGEC
ncbi:hypothetical protein ACJIZ3_006918 [Penstemon smallii]|uniref:Ubiquitin-like domain-containing protein n=1 Tax=Penstemon smallii TaxID=265156 RepID=A0ABD3S9A4_9LAMI